MVCMQKNINVKNQHSFHWYFVNKNCIGEKATLHDHKNKQTENIPMDKKENLDCQQGYSMDIVNFLIPKYGQEVDYLEF